MRILSAEGQKACPTLLITSLVGVTLNLKSLCIHVLPLNYQNESKTKTNQTKQEQNVYLDLILACGK